MHLILKILLFFPIFLMVITGLFTKGTAMGQSRFRIFFIIFLRELPKLIGWYVILAIIYLIFGYSMLEDLSSAVNWFFQ